jgi:hypothetical protein
LRPASDPVARALLGASPSQEGRCTIGSVPTELRVVVSSLPAPATRGPPPVYLGTTLTGSVADNQDRAVP